MTALLPCPLCSQPPAFMLAPSWHYARRTSAKRGSDHYLFTSIGCEHIAPITREPVPAADRPAVEQQWNAHAQALLAARTAQWTDTQRAAFAAKLGLVTSL